MIEPGRLRYAFLALLVWFGLSLLGWAAIDWLDHSTYLLYMTTEFR